MPNRFATFLLCSSLLLLALPAPAGAATVTLEAIRDNTLYEDMGGSLSNGIGVSFFVGTTGANVIRRGLVAFDPSAVISAGATIISAELTLTLTMTSSGPQAVELHLVPVAWGEGTSNSDMLGGGMGAMATTDDATWVHAFFPDTFWLNTGGDFFAQVSAVQTVNEDGAYTWGSTPQMVADVQGWLDDPTENHGWLLRGNESEPQTTKRFNSRENTDASSRPRLVVTFQEAIFADGFESGDTTAWSSMVP